ncbi:putative periplasmic protein [Mucinivorans hirudinis]|uniref:Putative periplasmic protein n=1 Tax=Mucinivorans hirudinis TaxID=1433126 RepID=A0A060R9F2_9BACT|nr:putative periplasmic protein [Mucinivorans hirudinis]
MKSNQLIGLYIAIGLVVVGFCINSAVKNFKMLDRTVVVKGLSEIETPADRVIWPISYMEVGNDLQQIFSQIEQKNNHIIKFLTDNGIKKEDITLSSPVVQDRQAEMYSPGNAPYRYNTTNVITVSSENVELVRELISKQVQLLKQNIALVSNWQFQTKYQFTKLNDIKPRMIEEATKNARASAEKFAEDSQSKLGKIKTASQGQLTILDRDENTQDIKILRVVTTIEYFLED